MKKLLAMMLMLLPMLAWGQDLANFVLMPDGTYQTKDGKDFVVIPFEGKTAHQIYQELASNVGSTFNDPSLVMPTNPTTKSALLKNEPGVVARLSCCPSLARFGAPFVFVYNNCYICIVI